jgi:hypothetical protein
MTNADSDKNRKRKEHQKRILAQQGGKPSGSDGKPISSKDEAKSSAFQELFTQRAQGFQIDFRFRNAPPRPPVGPTWVGHSLTQVLHDVSRQYQPSLQNSVEVNYKWKLHTESDLGIPLAPTAMDLKSYDEAAVVKDNRNATAAPLHPDDAALLDWKGAMGDTAADHLKTRRDRARAAARMAGMGKVLAPMSTAAPTGPQMRKAVKKKDFSRVLNDPLQTWMKKTTYLSNDYSRKVHDFKSLAQTKQELAVDLRMKQETISLRHNALAVAESFKDMPLVHPTRKHLKPKRVMPLLPNVDNWGRAYTHVVIDKAPNLKNTSHTNASLNKSIIANVAKREANAHMDCQLWVPGISDEKKKADTDKDEADSDAENAPVGDSDKKKPFEPVQEFDLDVLPLKEENVPATNFCLWVDNVKGIATYVPLSSRVHLTTGRPVRGAGANLVTRRPVTDQERDELEERMAEVDEDMAEKHHVVRERYVPPAPTRKMAAAAAAAKDDAMNVDKNDDGDDDFGDDDSSEEDEAVFGGATKTIVAEG